MKALRAWAPLLATVVALATGGCDDVTVVVLEPHRVEISPGPLTLDFTEASTLVARILDNEGHELKGYPVEWTVGDPSVVALLGPGEVEARGEGSTQLTATVDGGPSGSVDISVAPSRSLVVEPAAFAFTAIRGGASPASEQAQLGSTGAPIHGLEVRVGDQADAWAHAELSADVTDGTVSVTVDPSDLPAGEYETTLIFSSPVIRDTTVPVRLVVTDPPPPSIRLAPGVIVFQMDEGNGIPLSQALSVTTDGTAATALEAEVEYEGEPGGWLSVTMDRQSTPAVGQLVVTPPAGLAPGTYAATLTVSAPGAISATLVVSLAVAPHGGGGGGGGGGGDPDPTLLVDPPVVGFGGGVGGSAPAPVQVAVSSSGTVIGSLGSSVTYAAGQPGGWLTASLSSSATPAQLDLSAATGALPAGTFNAEVWLSGAGADPVLIPVTLVVSDVTPHFEVTPTSLMITADAGQNPAPVTVDISATAGTVAGLSAAIAYAPGSATGWLGVDLSATEAPSVATASVDVSGLGEGTYEASITFSAAGADDVVVPVTLSVSEAGIEIDVPVPTIEVVAPLGGALLGLIPVPVVNLGSVAVDDLTVDVTLGTGEPDWLTAEVTALAAPGVPGLLTLQAGAGLGSLAAGTYTADVAIRSTLYGTVAAHVRINLTVVDLGAIALAVDPGGLTLKAGAGGVAVQTDVTVHGILPGLLGALGVVQITAEVEYAGSASGWLDTEIADTSLTLFGSDSGMTLTANPAGLAPGRYEATVRVRGAVLGNPLLTVGTGTVHVYLDVPGG